MTPIFFPYTYMPTGTAKMLGVLFKRVVLYLPGKAGTPEGVRRLVESGWLETRIPVETGEEELAGALKNYHAWADLHLGGRGVDPALIKLQGERVPFFDDQRPARIKEDILGRPSSDPAAEKAGEEEDASLLKARMLLCMAQEFDVQCDEVNQRISSVEKMERDLLTSLKGGEEIFKPGSAGRAAAATVDSAGRMTGERLAAWGRIILEDPLLDDAGPTPFFVTTSREAFETSVEAAAGVELAELGEPSPGWEGQEDLEERLDVLVQGSEGTPVAGRIDVPAGEGADEPLSLTLAFIPGKTPGEVFGPREKPDAGDSADGPRKKGPDRILLGLVTS
ncbi:MAG: hypothetical protein GY859_38345 [Desulfobacterales bacterium]|nr:hypothetical protein [Desulfobacterales bacterium]